MADAIPQITMIDNDTPSYVTLSTVRPQAREGNDADKGSAYSAEPQRSQQVKVVLPTDEREILFVGSENGVARLWAVKQLNGNFEIGVALNGRDTESLGSFEAGKALELGVRPATKSNPTGIVLRAY